jgi:YebC/PmpR family DNA-binding regulatory protein
MGRAFEYRRARKEKRWDKMSRAFTKIGREISISVKLGGPDPANNPRLRMAIQNAKAAAMPKDKVEAAIKRASGKDESDFQEVVYEGYGPHGIAILVEAATDNPTRTIANIRLYFNRAGGSLGKSGSLDFIFTRKGVFRIAPGAGANMDDVELQLIDLGAEDIIFEEEEDGTPIAVVIVPFEEYGNMQKALENAGLPIVSAGLQRFPNSTTRLSAEQEEEILNLIDKIEDDDDVQAVYYNMAVSGLRQ